MASKLNTTCPAGERAHGRQELQIDRSFQTWNVGHKEISRCPKWPWLRATAGPASPPFADDQHLRDGRGLRVRNFAVHVPHESSGAAG